MIRFFGRREPEPDKTPLPAEREAEQRMASTPISDEITASAADQVAAPRDKPKPAIKPKTRRVRSANTVETKSLADLEDDNDPSLQKALRKQIFLAAEVARELTIAKAALEDIANGHRDPQARAKSALVQIDPAVGHHSRGYLTQAVKLIEAVISSGSIEPERPSPQQVEMGGIEEEIDSSKFDELQSSEVRKTKSRLNH